MADKKNETSSEESGKNEGNTSRSVHRVDLSLPVVQTDSYEIFYSLPSAGHSRLITQQKPLVDVNKKTANLSTRIRSPARLKHLIGPVVVNFVVDMSTMTNESSSTMGDTASNPVTHSSYSHRMMKGLPPISKRHKIKPVKDDSNHSQSSAGERLLYESLGSFDDFGMPKARNHNMWQNFHHPQLTSSKALHIRRAGKKSSTGSQVTFKGSNTTIFDNLSQASVASANEQLCEKIEQLTRTYFPAIQQLRNARPTPELLNNRMHLHREQRRYFMPVLYRTRVAR